MNTDSSVPITFAGGPTFMPQFMKSAFRDKLFTGNSYFNLNSNTKEFQALVEASRGYMRSILSIPNDHQIWFLGGGCHLQFAGLPLNFLGSDPNATANYTTTGYFSKLAFSEAKRYCNAKSICPMTTDEEGLFYLPEKYDFDPNAVYTHFIDNESVEGLSYSIERYPKVQGIPLFNDCSSSFLTREIDWSQADMAYAHVQKNAGISGLTVMILNERTLQTSPRPILPQLCSFESYKKKNGYHAEMNILPVYSTYVALKQWAETGGLHMNNYEKRAKRMYEVIDKCKIYKAKVRPEFRSKITVTWTIEDEKIMQECFKEGASHGLYEFKGHRTVGGCRACLFAPIPDEAVYRLADFLEDFAQKYE